MDQEDKSDVSNSETVAPRENLVNTAAKFLQNPRVRQSSLEQRKAFLEKKGLTFKEINLAIEKAGVTGEKIPLPPVEHVVQPPNVLFYSWWSIFAGITALGGLSFGFYKFFKIYISPYFVDRAKEQEHLERLDNSIRDLSLSMKQTLEQMHETLKSLQDVNQGRGTVGDIRSELNTIKGLMLSRRHFPPTPSTTSLIPSWQLESSTSKLAVSTTSVISSAEIVDSSDISPVSSSSQSLSPPNNDSPEKKTGSDEDTEVINHGDIPESHLTDDNGRTLQ